MEFDLIEAWDDSRWIPKAIQMPRQKMVDASRASEPIGSESDSLRFVSVF